MQWTVITPFRDQTNDSKWLTAFVPGEQHQFRMLHRQNLASAQSWHTRRARVTGYEEWLGFLSQTGLALSEKPDGIITVFPQLAATVGLRQLLTPKPIPVIAWCFNLGACYPGAKRLLAKTALKDINRFVVHSNRERENLSQWLELPLSRFEFVPLQRAEITITETEEMDNPFLLAMGSAQRDYPTLFKAVEKLGLRTVVVAGNHALAGLTIPDNVEVRSGLTMDECLKLAQKARISVVPLFDNQTASGQVTIVEAMRMNRPVIATRCIGSEDYIKNGETGLLVEPHSADDLAQAIEKLWNDPELRDNMGKQAGDYASQHFSDEAAGAALGRILDDVAKEVGLEVKFPVSTL
ncbi:glycosyltransferase family 4 protein [Microcoleus sp. herbarium7]|uniref:glycosyltransferase family 4 protein n=1 Tax=Microcoleus sp. herbarium7 TaxID=3055435 RepID=UPI002FCEE876